MLKFISLTGWDESVTPVATVEFLIQNPTAVAGIHFSLERRGEPMHPRDHWVEELCRLYDDHSEKLTHKLDAHLGNKWSLDVSGGDMRVLEVIVDTGVFGRVQLNHMKKNKAKAFLEGVQEYPEVEFILSRSHITEEFCQNVDTLAQEQGISNIAYLYDSSWGRGLTPEKWDKPNPHFFTGYAGGLGAHNLEEVIEWLQQLTNNRPFWVDMESSLRSDDKQNFHIDAAQKCVDIANKFIK